MSRQEGTEEQDWEGHYYLDLDETNGSAILSVP